MNTRNVLLTGIGCVLVAVVLAVAFASVMAVFGNVGDLAIRPNVDVVPDTQREAERERQAVPQPAPTLTLGPEGERSDEPTGGLELVNLYEQVNPGVVSVQVQVQQRGTTGAGAGSGFILNDEGYIVTNNHVVADAERVVVVFYNSIQTDAEVIGTDANSDLAVVRVDSLVEGAHPLPLGNSDTVQAGQRVAALGNPFGQAQSISAGIVSAVGRVIPTGTTPFSIPQAIQTDAAINPGNSGGPLVNMNGEVIGVNAQIATGGAPANAGVGFAIPSSIVRLVVPVLIQEGRFVWPWLGVSGADVGLILQEANDLDVQQGAYLMEVVPGGPADEAGLQGAQREVQIDGIDVPVGGDVVVAADGEEITSFSDLLNYVAFQRPGTEVELTILRNGEREQVTVELAPRPEAEPGDTQFP